MYKSTESEHLQLSFFQFNASCGMQLDSQNEWVKDANRLPWRVWESQYSAIFMTTTGNVAKPSRMVIGSLIIQQRMGFSDRDLVKQIQENEYDLRLLKMLIICQILSDSINIIDSFLTAITFVKNSQLPQCD